MDSVRGKRLQSKVTSFQETQKRLVQNFFLLIFIFLVYMIYNLFIVYSLVNNFNSLLIFLIYRYLIMLNNW